MPEVPDQEIHNGDNNQQAGRDAYRIDSLNVNLAPVISQSSQIAKVISVLSEKIDQEIPDNYSSISQFNIQDKISYNNVRKYKGLIDRYGFYGAAVENICSSLDIDRPNSRTRMFEFIKSAYLEEKGELEKQAGEITALLREKADDIIDAIYKRLETLVQNSSELEGIDSEDIRLGLLTLISVAFIECNILEKPPSQS
jgi:hypothetical protein